MYYSELIEAGFGFMNLPLPLYSTNGHKTQSLRSGPQTQRLRDPWADSDTEAAGYER